MPGKRRGSKRKMAKASPRRAAARRPARKSAPRRAGAGTAASAPKVMPFLWFDDDLEEAIAFYKSVFPGVRMWDVTRYPKGGPGPEGQVMSASFEIAGQRFGAVNGGPIFTFNESVSFVIDCKDQKEVDHYWSKLTADGGQESQCGWCKDKYGLSWQVVPRQLTAALSAKDPLVAQRAMQAMLPMRKIDIATIQAAVRG